MSKDLQGNSGCGVILVGLGAWIVAAAWWGWIGFGGWFVAVGCLVVVVNFISDKLEARKR